MVKIYGPLEVVFGILKITCLAVIVVALIAVNAGGWPPCSLREYNKLTSIAGSQGYLGVHSMFSSPQHSDPC